MYIESKYAKITSTNIESTVRTDVHVGKSTAHILGHVLKVLTNLELWQIKVLICTMFDHLSLKTWLG